jgi:membrane fusion protein (multidrug efflux system)
MTRLKRAALPPGRAITIAISLVAVVSCGGTDPATGGAPAAAASGSVAVDIVRVVRQPLDVQLSLPGELTAYQSVAIFSRVSGFVKTVSVDRGSRVQTGDLLATLEAPELVAQRSEAQSKLQGAEAQLSAARAKADADRSTFEWL